ncbi:MAG: flagellar export protein FliJ [Pirellulaceae bacterium]|nr:flagellar export protein FliJ [Pirellulaceae bacterium]
MKLREAKREQRQQELAEALHALDILQQQHSEIEESLMDHQIHVREESKPGLINVDNLIEKQRYQIALQMQLAEVQKKLGVVRKEIERRKTKMIEADREVKVLEKLKEKQREAHRQLENKEENKEFDEIGQTRYQRGQW